MSTVYLRTMEETNEELVGLYLSGNEEAFNELARRTLNIVYSFALRFTGSEEDAQDITQEIFVKMWRSLRTYNPSTSKFMTWIMRITRNTAIDSIRKKKYIPFSAFDTIEGKNILEENISDTVLLAEEVLIQEEDGVRVRQAVASLPIHQRDVIILHYTNHLTFEEIGKIFNEPTNTVKSRHYRALLTLRKIFTSTT